MYFNAAHCIVLAHFKLRLVNMESSGVKIVGVNKKSDFIRSFFKVEIESEYNLKFSVDEMGDLLTIKQVRKTMEEK